MADGKIDYELLLQMINCVKREVSMRYRVYPKRVAAGYMTQEQAKKEQELMYKVQVLLQNVYNGNVTDGVQQSFINAQEYIKGR